MLDIKFIRENTDLIIDAIANSRDSTPLDEILKIDTERRKKVSELEEFRRIRKESARQKQVAADEGRALRTRIRGLEEEVRGLDSQLNELLLRVPNIPQATVPVGSSEEDNAVVRSWGESKSLAFPPKPHWELGESLGIISFEWGVKLSGTRFYVLKGMGARLQRALIAFMLDLHTSEHGYQEVYLPFMVKRECMVGSGNLPKFADNLYHDVEDDLWFVPTAEVPITNLHRDEIITPGTLPMSVGSWGCPTISWSSARLIWALPPPSPMT